MSLDDLVKSIRTYRIRSPLTRLYVAPSIGLFLLWLYVWLTVFGYDEYYELGLIGFAIWFVLLSIVLLCCHWFVQVNCLLTYVYESNVERATHAHVCPTPHNGWSELIPINSCKLPNGELKIWLEFQRVVYTFDADKKIFRTLSFDTNQRMKYFQRSIGFCSDEELNLAKSTLGDNKMEMMIPEFWDLFKERATAPFFVFQVFCVGLWCLEDMWYFSLFTLAMLATFEAALVKAQMKNMQEIRNMGNKPFEVHVYRSKKWLKVPSDQLVPGDIVSIGRSADEQNVPCDVLLLRGPCIVDESMLTGESVPQMKEPIEDIESERIFDIISDSRLHVICGGTKIVQHTSPTKADGLRAPDGGCVCYVLRTGFNTSQGKLLRTIMFGVKRVTANNFETLLFILFLLIFAVAASGYLWVVGSQDEKRSKYKLFLECTLILTSVIPPELPIELSLAVNSSLIALQKLGIFCTEPFRIPFAGKIDVCCFDKTGTLTTDNLVVEGVAMGSSSGKESMVKNAAEISFETLQVLGCCHSLVRFDDDLVGDPLEKACLNWCEWTVTKADSVMPPKGSKYAGMKIFNRFHFSSALKRMSVVAGYNAPGSQDPKLFVAVKGAPEILRDMYSAVPEDYDATYTELTRQGARVLALGLKELHTSRPSDIRDKSRDYFENNLTFVGFVVISCPLKPDTKAMVKEIIESSHKVVMITGDNALTACHVARVLKFVKRKNPTLILDEPQEDKWMWRSCLDDETFELKTSFSSKEMKEFCSRFDFCLTGVGFAYLLENHHKFLKNLLPHIHVYARMAPKQKERVINELKLLGKVTLMCGDGTNDVGALKHSDVGVALLSHPFDATKAEQKKKEREEKIEECKRLYREANPVGIPRRPEGPSGARHRNAPPPPPAVLNAQKKLEQMMKEMEEEEKAQVVKLGDASIAAPFTSKYTSIASICHVIKQGRCTLVTTLQMFKILALNALISAYSLSVLYLDGVKFSDTQATIQGLLLAACFLFISRSKPLNVLSRQRPMPTIFNAYTLLTVTIQFAIHFSCLLYVVNEAHLAGGERTEPVDLEAKFTPNILNTTVYVISMALQVCTFAVNYRGRPFMESLFENKAMLLSVLFSGTAVFSLAMGLSPEMMQQFELVDLPSHLRDKLVFAVFSDLAGCFAIDRILNFLLGDMF